MMPLVQGAWHWLIVLHHGSHHDFHIWQDYITYITNHPYVKPWKAAERVRQILLKDPALTG